MEIQLARSERERELVYQFRYKIYINEMKRKQYYCDHINKRIYEPLDTTAHIFAAFDNKDQVIGTVRVNYARDGNLGIYEKLYKMQLAGENHPYYTSVTTKLMTAENYRNAKLVKALCCAAYEKGINDNIKIDFIDTNLPLVNFFLRFGYRVLNNINHPEYGDVKLMQLHTTNIDHLKQCKSPFYAIIKNHLNNHKHVEKLSMFS